MENFNEKILDTLKSKIAVSKFAEEEVVMKKENKSKVFKSVAIASVILISSTGLVFAKEIEKFIVEKLSLRTMYQDTVDNGYIGTAEMDYIEVNAGVQINDNKTIIDNVNTKLKVSDFMLTDDFFDFEVEMQFDEKINQYKDLNRRINGNIDYENFGSIQPKNIFILDESNRLLASPVYDNESDREAFNKFCEEHNLDYTYREYNENYINWLGTVYGAPDTIIPEENKLENIIFSINPMGTVFPKSKHLTIYFSELIFEPKLNRGDTVHLIGDWKIDLDIPEIMQNRSDCSYKVVNCDNKDFEITSAIADETGFELGLTINNVKQPKYPEELIQKEEEYKQSHDGNIHYLISKEGLLEFFGSEELVKMYEDYYEEKEYIRITDRKDYYWQEESKGCYIVDQNGKEFKARNGGQPFNHKYEESYDENGYSHTQVFDVIEGSIIFDMTRFDAPDNMTVYIEFKGEPVKIELEKIK